VRGAAAVVLAALVAIAGCGQSADSAGTRITSDTLSIYTSLPLRGARAAVGRGVLRGEKLALDEAGGHIGNLSIGLVALDDTSTATGVWDPGQVAANARQAAENPTTIAYIGDLDSGASAVSVPITNETGVLQVSPLSGYTGLTQPADKGEPAKYYPSGRRTFARLVGTGAQEAHALAAWVRSMGFGRVALAYDGLQEGLGQGNEVERALQSARIEVVDVLRVNPQDGTAELVGNARDLTRKAAPALIYAGAATPVALALLRAVHGRDPGEALFVTSGVVGMPFVAGLQAAEGQVHIISPLVPVARRPADAARMAVRYRERFGAPAPPSALYGYEAMRAILDALRRAGNDSNDRQTLIDAYFHTTAAHSVLGPYAIDERGDTTSPTYGAFRVRAGRLRMERLLTAATG